MKVSQVTKLKEKFEQFDISTETENFYVKAGNSWILIHNSPAMFLGIVPAGEKGAGKFFVAKKSLFNKAPIYYTSEKEILNDLDGDLRDKFLVTFKVFSPAASSWPKGVVLQGDLMFDKASLKKETINGNPYITFHPNTIVYAIPADSKLAAKIRNAEVGIIFHTAYNGGDTFDGYTSSHNIDISKIRAPKAWMQSADLKDASDLLLFSKNEIEEMKKIGREIEKERRNKIFDFLFNNQTLATLVATFVNSLVRRNISMRTSETMTVLFNEWLLERKSKDMATVKTARGKDSTEQRYSTIFDVLTPSNLNSVFTVLLLLSRVKEITLDKLNKAGGMSTFVKTVDGAFKVTSQEGFVAITQDGAVKLVDRYEFSKNNFAQEILKGWN